MRATGARSVVDEALFYLDVHERDPELYSLDDVRAQVTVTALMCQGWSVEDAFELWRVSAEIVSASDVGRREG